ncbi:MAG: hypothetical protein AAFX78_02400 [Cyanobacteria bacterium J06638_20]
MIKIIANGKPNDVTVLMDGKDITEELGPKRIMIVMDVNSPPRVQIEVEAELEIEAPDDSVLVEPSRVPKVEKSVTVDSADMTTDRI